MNDDAKLVLELLKELGAALKGLQSEKKAPKENKPQCIVFDKQKYDRQKALTICSQVDLSIANVKETDRFIYVTQHAKDPEKTYSAMQVEDGIQAIIDTG